MGGRSGEIARPRRSRTKDDDAWPHEGGQPSATATDISALRPTCLARTRNHLSPARMYYTVDTYECGGPITTSTPRHESRFAPEIRASRMHLHSRRMARNVMKFDAGPLENPRITALEIQCVHRAENIEGNNNLSKNLSNIFFGD